MANLKEIVTKAVIGKTKKSTKQELKINTDQTIDTILGCWVINHNFNGFNKNGKVIINGSYDINVWYSYENNTKTDVLVKNFTYQDTVNVRLKNEEQLTEENEIIVRSLMAPSVTDVKTKGAEVELNVEKELGVEVVGNMKVRINVAEDFDDYDQDDEFEEEAVENIDENYLNGVNQ